MMASAFTLSHAQQADKSDTKSYSEKEKERTESAMKKEYGRQQEEKRCESMRDKSHDNRIKLDKNTSIGAEKKDDGAMVNGRITY